MEKTFLKILGELRICFAGIIAFLGYFLGGFDNILTTLLIFIVLDYITGVIEAISTKKLSSRVGGKGIAKKIYILILVGVSNLLGNSLEIEGLRYIVISFYLANEGISIIENATRIGVPIPKKIVDVLDQLKSKGSEEVNEQN